MPNRVQHLRRTSKFNSLALFDERRVWPERLGPADLAPRERHLADDPLLGAEIDRFGVHATALLWAAFSPEVHIVRMAAMRSRGSGSRSHAGYEPVQWSPCAFWFVAK